MITVRADDQQHIVPGHGQDIAEQIAVKVPGIALGESQEHYTQGHARSHEDADGSVLGDAGPVADHANA